MGKRRRGEDDYIITIHNVGGDWIPYSIDFVSMKHVMRVVYIRDLHIVAASRGRDTLSVHIVSCALLLLLCTVYPSGGKINVIYPYDYDTCTRIRNGAIIEIKESI